MVFELLIATAASQAVVPAVAPLPPPAPVEALASAPQASSAASEIAVIPALTPVDLRVDADLVSKTATIGQEFDIVLASPLVLANGMMVPVGTRGRGYVIHASKAGFAGKAGELLLGARYLKLGDVQIPLRSMKIGTPQGKDNTGLAMGLSATVGIVGMFVGGGQARVESGMRAYAKTAADTPVPTTLLTPGTPTGPAIVATIAPGVATDAPKPPAPPMVTPAAQPVEPKTETPKGTDK